MCYVTIQLLLTGHCTREAAEVRLRPPIDLYIVSVFVIHSLSSFSRETSEVSEPERLGLFFFFIVIQHLEALMSRHLHHHFLLYVLIFTLYFFYIEIYLHEQYFSFFTFRVKN